MTNPRVLVVTNFATHYRAPLYELMHERLGVEFVFFSQGGEEYWQPHLGVSEGRFPAMTVTGGRSFGKTRLGTGLRNEMRSRQFDVVVKCMNGRAELPIAYAAARRQGAAFVLWTGMWMHPVSAFHTISHPVTRWIYRNSDAIVTYGEHVSQFVVAEGAEPEGVFVAENAVDNTLYSRCVSPREVEGLRRRLGIGDTRVVLAVSRLVRQKGIEFLIDAAAGLVPRPCVVVVGTGPLARGLRERAASAGVTLRIVEGLSPSEMPAMYAAADIFVMPSIATRTFKEPWGLACNEAMAQGIPVVASDAVGAAAGGLVRDGETGVVVPEQNEQALHAALQLLLTDQAIATRLGDSGRRRVSRTNYSHMVDGFERAIEYAMDRRGAQL